MSIVSRSMLVGIVAFALAGCGGGGGAITPELLQQIPESGPGKPVTLAEYEKVLGGSRDGDSLTSDKFQAQIDRSARQLVQNPDRTAGCRDEQHRWGIHLGKGRGRIGVNRNLVPAFG